MEYLPPITFLQLSGFLTSLMHLYSYLVSLFTFENLHCQPIPAWVILPQTRVDAVQLLQMSGRDVCTAVTSQLLQLNHSSGAAFSHCSNTNVGAEYLITSQLLADRFCKIFLDHLSHSNKSCRVPLQTVQRPETRDQLFPA